MGFLGVEIHRKGFASHQAEKIEVLATVSDHYFSMAYPELSALSPTKSVRVQSESTFVKTARHRLDDFSGLTSYQSFILELECLVRLNKLTDENGRSPFPKLYSFDVEKREIESSHVGHSLSCLNYSVDVRCFGEQIASIVALLKKAGVIHLDNHPSGKNVCVSDEGRIYLIDFDLAAIDGVALGPYQQKRLNDFYENGGYEGFADELALIISNHPNIRIID